MSKPFCMEGGVKYNRLTSVGHVGQNEKGEQTWLFQCECGNTIIWSATNVRSGQKKNCGCGRRHVIHGMSHERLYNVWKNMKARCLRPTCKDYKNYGGRGVLLFVEWHDYLPFRAWAYGNGYEDGLQLDRRDNEGNYEPGNCRFISQEDNARNTRSTIIMTINGRTMCLSQWAEEINVSKNIVFQWFYKFGPEEAGRRISALLIS